MQLHAGAQGHACADEVTAWGSSRQERTHTVKRRATDLSNTRLDVWHMRAPAVGSRTMGMPALAGQPACTLTCGT